MVEFVFDFWVVRVPRTGAPNSSVRFSISSGVIFGGSTLDRNQEYLLCVFLEKLSSCQRARETLVRKRCQRFWKALPTVKPADTLLINSGLLPS
jgi:hypothetical protein